MAQRVVIYPGRFSLAVGFASLVALVSMTFGVLLSSPRDTDRVILGLGTAVGTLLGLHLMLNRVVIDPERVVILGQGFRLEFLCADVVAVDVDVYLKFYLRTGDFESVDFVNCAGLNAPLVRPRVQRVIATVQEALDLVDVPAPPAEADPYWCQWPRPASKIVKRSINWPPLWLLTTWTLWLIGIFIYRAM